MDLGSGIALGALCVSAAPVCIVALRRSNGNGNGKNNGHCHDHSGICQRVENFEGWLEKIEEKLDRVIEGKVGR